MDYKLIYEKLINKYKILNLDKNEQYLERHHIVPKSLGGNNSKDNLVNLPPKAHFIAHLLLANMYPEGSKERFKMQNAVMFFHCGTRKMNRMNEIIVPSSRVYELIRKEYAKLVGERLAIANKGKTKSEEFKEKIKQAHKDGKLYKVSHLGYKNNDEQKKKMSDAQKNLYLNGYVNPRLNIKLSDDTKNKIGLKNKDNIKVFKDDKCIAIKKDQLQKYLDDGWTKGNINIKGKCKNNKWIHKDNKLKWIKQSELQEYLDNGWKLGMIKGRKNSDEMRRKLSEYRKGCKIINGKLVKE